MLPATYNSAFAPEASSITPLARAPIPIGINDGIALADCWRIIRRSLRLILGLLAGSMLLTLTAILFATPNYKASSTLLIEPEPPQVLDIRDLINESGSTQDHDYYKTQYDLLMSRDLAANVIRKLNLQATGLLSSLGSPEPPPWYGKFLRHFFGRAPAPSSQVNGVNAAAIDAYLSRFTVEPIIGTRLVTVSFSAPDRDLAARVVNTHVDQYIQQGLGLRSESRRTAVEFLEKQLVEIKQRVQQSEAALNTYRHQKGIVSFDVENNARIAQDRMQGLTRAFTEAETKRITADAQMRQVQGGDYDSLPQVVGNPTITALKPRVLQLQSEFANMSTAFNPQYPKLAELKAELRDARSTLNREIAEVARAVQRDYASAVAQEQQLRVEIDHEKERDLASNDASLQDAVLAREVETNRDLYKNVLLRMEQIQIGEEAPVTNVSIVDRAVSPRLPSTPKKRRDLAIASLLALMCGIALAFLFDQLDNRLKTSEEVEQYLHLPNLAVAPDFATLHSVTHAQRRLSDVFAAVFRPHQLIRVSFKDLGHQPGLREVYRSIRTALLFSRAGAPPQKILITSAIEGEGKTWTALHVALAFAQTGARTLLIDADLRRAQCHEQMGVDNSVGLSEVLVGQLEPEEGIRYIDDQALFLLPAGSHVPNPAELLTSTRMLDVLKSLSRRYQYIFIDSAPLMFASDTAGVATMTDGVVLVAGAKTPKQCVRHASERLFLAGAKVFGVVLNRVDIHHPDHRQYSRYYFSYDKPVDSLSTKRDVLRRVEPIRLTDEV